MKQKWKNKLVSFLLLAAILLPLSGHGNVVALVNPEAIPENFAIVAENDEAILYYNRRAAMIRVESKATGIFFDTKAIEGEGGNNFTKNQQRSDMVFEYIGNKRTGLTTTIDNYSMAIELQQYEHEEIENGVRLSYHLGQEQITLQNLPKYIASDKMFEKVISFLSESQRETLLADYTLVGDRYVRRSDSGVAQLRINRLYQYFYEDGEYTEEDLVEDNASFGIEVEDTSVSIDASIEYVLDGKDLVVRVPISEIEVGGGYPLAKIRLLPYILSAEEGQDGYIIVPDGSGAVMNFDNNRFTASNYSGRVYGDDILRNVSDYSPDRYPVTLPMAAIKYDDHAILATIEEGAEIATINSEISGKTDEFNKVNFTFNVMEIEQVRSVGDSNVTLPRASTDVYDGDIVIRYQLIDEGEYGEGEVDYVKIATAYRSYLLENGLLGEQTLADEAPLFVELLGSIEKRKFFLGIPYNANISLTSFKEMGDILTDLQARGVAEINAEITGFANNGMLHGNLQKIKPERVLGGKRGFETLLELNGQDGINLFPTVNLTQTHGTKGIDARNHVSRMLSGEYARVPMKNHVNLESKIDRELSPYLLSPLYYEEYLNEFIESSEALGLANLSITDLGNRLVADYSASRDTGRWQAEILAAEALAQVSGGFDQTLISNPNQYALQFANMVTDLPGDSNQNKSFDYSIPFVQLVLDGVMNYSGSAVNMMSFEEPSTVLLRSIEYRMSPKYQLTHAEDSSYTNTKFDGLLVTNYRSQAQRIEQTYKAYNRFYQLVKDSLVSDHQVLGEFERVVTYDNGVSVVLNYASTARTIQGVEVDALSYEIIE